MTTVPVTQHRTDYLVTPRVAAVALLIVCREVLVYAIDSGRFGSHRRRRSSVAGQYLYPHGGLYQVHPERRRCHSSGFVAA
jgi:hypothetical protein